MNYNKNVFMVQSALHVHLSYERWA